MLVITYHSDILRQSANFVTYYLEKGGWGNSDKSIKSMIK